MIELFLNNLLVYRRIYLYFLSSLFKNKKKILKTYLSKRTILNVHFALKLRIYRFFIKFYMSQMNPKEFVHNTAYSDQLPYIASHSL